MGRETDGVRGWARAAGSAASVRAWLVVGACLLAAPAGAMVHGETAAAGASDEVVHGEGDVVPVGVDTSTGAATLAIPIELPPGPPGATPALAFRYSSAAGDGLLGVGWTLPIPQIACSSRSGAPRAADCDRFELAGEPLVGPDLDGRYHTFTETFQRIERRPHEWIVTTTEGRVLRFGARADARFGPPGAPRAWLLSRSEDVFGNAVDYVWTRGPDGPDGVPRLAQIVYAQGTRAVRFVYEPRPDPSIDYAGGLRRVQSERLREVRVHVADQLHHRVVLRYETARATTRSRLVEVQRFGSDCDPAAHPVPSSEVCSALPAARFAWNDSATLDAIDRWAPTGRLASLDDQPDWYAPERARFGTADLFLRGQSSQLADVDGDGLLDVVTDRVSGRRPPLFHGRDLPEQPRSAPFVHLNDGAHGWEEPLFADGPGSAPLNDSALWTNRLQALRFDIASIRVDTVRSYWMSEDWTAGPGEPQVVIGPEEHGTVPGEVSGDLPVLGTCYDGDTPPRVEFVPDGGSVEYAPAKKFTDSPAFDATANRSWIYPLGLSTGAPGEWQPGDPLAWDTPAKSEVRPWPHFQLVDLNADGRADLVMSVHLSGFHVSLDDCTSPESLAEPEWVEGATTRVVFLNTGEGWTRDDGRTPEDGTWADSLPPFGVVAFESADLAYLRIGATSTPPLVWRDAGARTVSPCDDYGLAGQRVEDPFVYDFSYDFCLTTYDLAPVFTDLDGDGFPDLVVTETSDPDALFHRFFTTWAHEGTPEPVGYRDATTRSVAWLQDPDPAPGAPRWVRAPAYDPPIDHALVLQYPTESPGSLANGWANTGDFGNAQVWNVDKGVRFADLNRDGQTDVVVSAGHHPWADFGETGGVLLNRGARLDDPPHAAWCASAPLPGVDPCVDEAARYAIPFLFAEFDPRPISVVDPTGPGSGDWATNWGNSNLLPTQRGLDLVDLNADGWVDVLEHDRGDGTTRAWIHQPGASGTVWQADDRFAPPARNVFMDASQDFPSASSGIDFGGSGYAIVDANGDGVPDLVASERLAMIHKESWISDPTAGQTDRLARYANGRGLVVELAYAAAVAQRDPTLEARAEAQAVAPFATADPDDDGYAEPAGRLDVAWSTRSVLVEQRVMALGREPAVTRHRWAHPRRCPIHRMEQGFRLVESLRPDGARHARFFYQDHGRSGRLAREETRDEHGRPRHVAWAEWAVVPPETVPGAGRWPTSAGVERPRVGRLVRRGARHEYGDAIGDASGFETAVTLHYDDDHGYGFVREEVHDVPGRSLRILRTPTPVNGAAEARHLRLRVAREVIRAAEPRDTRLLADTRFVHRDADGRETWTRVGTRWEWAGPRGSEGRSPFADPPDAPWIRTEYAYGARGQLVLERRVAPGATDPGHAGDAGDASDGSRTTRFCWDGLPGCPTGQRSGAMLVRETDPLGGVREHEPDAVFSVATRTTSTYRDVPTVLTALDALGRPIATRLAPAPGGDAVLRSETLHVDAPTGGWPLDDGRFAPFRVERRFAEPDAGSALERVVVEDGLGEAALTIELRIDDGSGVRLATLVARRRLLEPAARRRRESEPFACGEAIVPVGAAGYAGLIARCLAVPESERDETVFEADALGRPVRVETPLGVERMAHGAERLPALGAGLGPVVAHDVVRHEDAGGGLVETVVAGGRPVRVRECNGPTSVGPNEPLAERVCEAPDESRLFWEPTGELRERWDPTVDENPRVAGLGAPIFPSQRLARAYDALGRVIRVEDPDAGVRQQSWDAFGNPTTSIDARGVLIVRRWDALDRPLRIEVAGEAPTLFEYRADQLGRERMRDGEHAQHVAYDAFGRVRRVVRVIDGRLLRIDRRYDGLDRLVAVAYPTVLERAVDTIAYDYDGAFLKRVCDVGLHGADCDGPNATPLVEAIDYDGLGRPTRMALPGGDRRFTWDGRSMRIVTDVFDSDAPGHDVAFRHVESGSNDVPAYDALGHPTRVEADVASGQGGVAYEAHWTYDARHRIATWRLDGETRDYAFDRRGNLVLHAGVVQDYGPGPRAHAPTRRREAAGDRTYAWDASGRLATVTGPDGATHYGWDGRGRLVCVGRAADGCERLRVAYDGDGERILERGAWTDLFAGHDFRVRPAGPNGHEYWIEVHALGQRIATKHGIGGALRVVGGGPAHGLGRDPEHPLDRLLGASARGRVADFGRTLVGLVAFAALVALAVGVARAPVPQRAGVAVALGLAVALLPIRVWAGARVLRPPGPGAAVYRFVLSDPLGSSRVEIDAAGRRVAHTTLEPFGAVVPTHSAGASRGRAYYAGHERQAETGLVYMNARWMDPRTGTFLSVDPVVRRMDAPAAWNGYAYAEGNPIAAVDPTGETTEWRIVWTDAGGNRVASTKWQSGTPGGDAGRNLSGLNISVDGQDAGFVPITASTRSVGADGTVRFAGRPADASGGAAAEASGLFDEARVRQLHAMAREANARASFVVGGGATVSAFAALSVDVDGEVGLDFGLGVGAGEMSVVSLSAEGELRGGEMGAARLEFVAGGAVGGGALHKSAVSLTTAGASAGGGFVIGQGGFVFLGPSVSISLGNVRELFPVEQEE